MHLILNSQISLKTLLLGVAVLFALLYDMAAVLYFTVLHTELRILIPDDMHIAHVLYSETRLDHL